MKSGLPLIAMVLVFLTSCGDPPRQEWNYSSLASTPENWGSLKIATNHEVKTPDGKPTLELIPEYDRDDMEWQSHLRYPALSSLVKNAKTAEITFWIKGDAGTQIAVRLTSATSFHYTATRYYDLTGDWQRIEFKEVIKGPISGKWVSAPRLLLEKNKAGQHFFVGPVTFKAVE